MTRPRLIKSKEQLPSEQKAKLQPLPVISKNKTIATINGWKQQWQATGPQQAREQFAALFS